MAKINSKKVTAHGREWDSLTELEHYEYLLTLPNVQEIEIQPQFILLDTFSVVCNECNSTGRVTSPKTGNLIKCRKCSGEGEKKRLPLTYTADFEVTYKDGWVETIDVKGGKYQARESTFALRKKMFEHTTGRPLIVVIPSKGGWLRL